MRELAWDALMNGELAHAQGILEEWKPKTQAEARERSHYFGKILQFEGRWRDSYNSFCKAEEKFGAHVGLRCDMLASLYMLNDFYAWELAAKKFVEDYPSFSASLTNIARARTEIFIGKMLEEMGDAAAACEYYHSSSQITDIDVSDKMIADAQAIRVRAFFGLPQRLPLYYRRLISYEEKWGTEKLAFEVLHALMHAEMALLGLELAFLRLERILLLPNLSEVEKRLVFYDFLEEAIRKNWGRKKISQLLLLQPKSEPSIFESWVMRLRSSLRREQIVEFGALASQLSLDSYLRLLLLALQKQTNKVFTAEIRAKFGLLLASLPARSVTLWSKRLREVNLSAPASITLNLERSSLSFRAQRISLHKKVTTAAALRAFTKTKSISMEELAVQIWGTKKFNSSYYFRIRMLLGRLNQDIAKKFGIGTLFSFESGRISLSSGLEIKSRGAP